VTCTRIIALATWTGWIPFLLTAAGRTGPFFGGKNPGRKQVSLICHREIYELIIFMSRTLSLLVGAGVIFLVLAAGCTSPQNIPTAITTPVPGTPQATIPTTIPPVTGVQAQLTTTTTAPVTCSANIQTDPVNCGQCGAACPQNAACQSGQCYCMEGYTVSNNACVVAPAVTGTTPPGNGCPAGMSPCPDGYCYELASSPANCGTCGNTCSPGLICSASTCVSPVTPEVTTVTTTVPVTTTAAVTTTGTLSITTISPGATLIGPGLSKTCMILGRTQCGGACVNTSTDASNCGGCGKVCIVSTPTCCGGSCVNILTDNNNCGSCGHKCLIYGSSCSAGSCKVKTVITSAPIIPKITTAPMINPDIGKLL
jgi:hypothetical protein